MINVLLTGGLGNQLFQYAFGRALAERNRTALVLHTAYLESKLPFKKWATPMRYELGVFHINAQVKQNIFSAAWLYPFAKAEYLLRDSIHAARYTVLQETDHAFHADYLQAGDNVYVKGNFQSEKYFADIAPLLRQELVFASPLTGQNAVLQQQIRQSAAVALHIRRGDYISLAQNAGKFAQVPLSYYQEAMQYIAARISHPEFYVFSDDIPWAKAHLPTGYQLHFVSHNQTPETSYIDMQLMAACQHQIIANSTFSWWGAWLNAHPQKMVLAPKLWFADNRINSADILPSEWIKL
jgi:hypothetical protein